MTVSLYVEPSASMPGLRLRPWRSDDLAIVLHVYRDPVMRLHAAARIDSEADAQRWLDAQQQGWATERRLSFAITEVDTADPDADSPIGNVVVKRPVLDGPSAEVGYWTAPAARGRGVAPRALEAVACWALDSPYPHIPSLAQVNRLELIHDVDNEASCRVAQKCGFAFETDMSPHPPAWPLAGHLHARMTAGDALS